MRRIHPVGRILTGIPSLVWLGAGLLVAAEPPLKPAPPPGTAAPPSRLTTGAWSSGRPTLGFEQILTPEQRQQFRTAMEKEGDRVVEVDRQLQQARRDLENAVMAERTEEAAIRQKAQAIADLESRRAMMRARGFAAIRSSLTPEQLERIKTLSAGASEVLSGPLRSPADGGDPRMGRPGGPPAPRPKRPVEPK